MSCLVCKELREDRTKHPSSIIHITEIRIDGAYYNWGCDINYCPECGRKIEADKKVKTKDEI